MLTRLFVYGTLLADLAPRELGELVSSFRFLGRARLRGLLVDLGAYPGLLVDPDALHPPLPDSKRLDYERTWAASLRELELRGGSAPGEVRGELVDIASTPDLLRQLDEYEDYTPVGRDNLFDRVVAEVRVETGGEQEDAVLAWVYAYPRAPDPLRWIPHGDYRRYRGV